MIIQSIASQRHPLLQLPIILLTTGVSEPVVTRWSSYGRFLRRSLQRHICRGPLMRYQLHEDSEDLPTDREDSF